VLLNMVLGVVVRSYEKIDRRRVKCAAVCVTFFSLSPRSFTPSLKCCTVTPPSGYEKKLQVPSACERG
jgi:hypothetical protein